MNEPFGAIIMKWKLSDVSLPMPIQSVNWLLGSTSGHTNGTSLPDRNLLTPFILRQPGHGLRTSCCSLIVTTTEHLATSFVCEKTRISPLIAPFLSLAHEDGPQVQLQEEMITRWPRNFQVVSRICEAYARDEKDNPCCGCRSLRSVFITVKWCELGLWATYPRRYCRTTTCYNYGMNARRQEDVLPFVTSYCSPTMSERSLIKMRWIIVISQKVFLMASRMACLFLLKFLPIDKLNWRIIVILSLPRRCQQILGAIIQTKWCRAFYT